MNILVTGGAGYLGSVLVENLLAHGHRVTVLDILMIGGEGILSHFGKKQFNLVVGDIRNAMLLKNLSWDFDSVVHLAALVGEPACEVNPALAKSVNHTAAVNMASLAKEKGVKRFIFLSSSSNYGVSKANEEADENILLMPLSLYSETKADAEKDILKFSDSRFHVSVVRLSMLFGLSPRMRFNLLINELVRDACFGKEVILYKGDAWRPYTHIQDAGEAIIKILEAKTPLVSSQIFNVGTENYQKKNLLPLLRKHFPKMVVVDKGGDANNRDYRVSFEKIKKTLGFKPKKSVADGIDEMIWALKNGIFSNPFDENYSCWIKESVFE